MGLPGVRRFVGAISECSADDFLTPSTENLVVDYLNGQRLKVPAVHTQPAKRSTREEY